MHDNKTEDQDKSNPIPPNFIRIPTSTFLDDLPGCDVATGTCQSNINGWQIKLNDLGNNLVEIEYSSVNDNGFLTSSNNANMRHYEHLAMYNITDVGDPPASNSGPFPKSMLTSRDIDFYYLTKENLDMLLQNNPVHLYLSAIMFNFGWSISGSNNDNFSTLRIECRNNTGPLIVTYGNSTVFPLFVFAPPCPPAWNPIYRNLPGYGDVTIVGKSVKLDEPRV